jgi:3',5'-nucleoside bisphosphate phosphatase
MKCCDLHIHTIHSDGTDTPQTIIGRAARQGLSAISITDHDSVDGVEEAIRAGDSCGIEVLPGIELTAEFDGAEVHMLGYRIEHRDPAFNRALAGLRENRVERVLAMIKKLSAQDIVLKPEAVFSLSGSGTVGRLHMARAMVNEGIVGSVPEAFYKYIGDKCPAYVSHFRLTPATAIAMIREYGGVPVLAHPHALKKDEYIPAMAEAGLRGLEVYYPEHSQAVINFYLDCAKRLGLLITGGSDYHGAAKPGVELGEAQVPYTVVEALNNAA